MQALVFLHACRTPLLKAGVGQQAAAARKEALRSKQARIRCCSRSHHATHPHPRRLASPLLRYVMLNGCSGAAVVKG
jgi:hypothetical protein